jgi:asparagine synthase (glutamine-hydrolysing)
MYFARASFAPLRALAYRWRYGFLTICRNLSGVSPAIRGTRAMQVLEITETNLPMLLRFEDKNSMRFGIETRLPFLDYRLVEFTLGLPTRVKLTKWPLRVAMQNLLSENICRRKDKIGFRGPRSNYGSGGIYRPCR